MFCHFYHTKLPQCIKLPTTLKFKSYHHLKNLNLTTLQTDRSPETSTTYSQFPVLFNRLFVFKIQLDGGPGDFMILVWDKKFTILRIFRDSIQQAQKYITDFLSQQLRHHTFLASLQELVTPAAYSKITIISL